MPRGGKAWDGEVIAQRVSPTGETYEYRLVRWEEEPRIGFRWIDGAPAGYRPCVTLDAALYPAILRCVALPEAQREARAFLGPVLGAGYYLDGHKDDGGEAYRRPEEVTAPDEELGPFAVLWSGGPGDCAYMLGMWDQRLEVAFRWNGTQADPNGYPTSSGGKPQWIRLEPNVHPAVVELLARQGLAGRLGSAWR